MSSQDNLKDRDEHSLHDLLYEMAMLLEPPSGRGMRKVVRSFGAVERGRRDAEAALFPAQTVVQLEGARLLTAHGLLRQRMQRGFLQHPQEVRVQLRVHARQLARRRVRQENPRAAAAGATPSGARTTKPCTPTERARKREEQRWFAGQACERSITQKVQCTNQPR